jgi:hypothetical protein
MSRNTGTDCLASWVWAWPCPILGCPQSAVTSDQVTLWVSEEPHVHHHDKPDDLRRGVEVAKRAGRLLRSGLRPALPSSVPPSPSTTRTTAISALPASGCARDRRSIARIVHSSMGTACCATARASSTAVPAPSSRAVAQPSQHARSCAQSTRAPVISPAISQRPMRIWSHAASERRSRCCLRTSSASSGWIDCACEVQTVQETSSSSPPPLKTSARWPS